jgi:hypothetical protein
LLAKVPVRDPESPRGAVARFAPAVLVGCVPAGLLALGVARFILHHFFAHAPYLLDSGWLSAVVYRAGLIPRNPSIACDWATYFYGVHFSPILSVFSLLSYLVPLPRIEWYAVVQGLIYVPIGIAVYCLWASGRRPWRSLDVLAATCAALAFSFCGIVIVFIGSPHYEAAIPGLICLLLASVVTDRPRLAWICLGVTVAVREDAGIHAALALAPLLWVHLRTAAVRPGRRILVQIIVASVAASAAALAVQKLCFHPVSMIRHVYLGDPAFDHLSPSLLFERLRSFLAHRQVIYYPFLVTVVFAALRRDPRYLLGWLSALPWFLLNLFAVEDEKSAFNAYTAFPFLVSMFWVPLYGAFLAPEGRRQRRIVNDLGLALASLSSTLGLYLANPSMLTSSMKEMVYRRTADRSAVHGFADALVTHRGVLGRLYVDPSVAAVAAESLALGNTWRPGLVDVDSLAFHRDTWLGPELAAQLFTSRLTACTGIAGTGFVVCTRAPLPPDVLEGVPTRSLPPVFAVGLRERVGIRIEPRGVTARDGATIQGTLGLLPRGNYRLVLALEASSAAGSALASVEIVSEKSVVASMPVPNGHSELDLDFAADGDRSYVCRIRTTGPELLVVSASLSAH